MSETMNLQTSDYENLECPLCGVLRPPFRVVLTKDRSDVAYVSYRCNADHINHGNTYIWKIMKNGDLVD